MSEWKRSSYCQSGECVEVAWYVATLSAQNGNCIEAGRGDCGMVHVRDSKRRSDGVLSFRPDEWAAFIAGAKAGEFDLG